MAIKRPRLQPPQSSVLWEHERTNGTPGCFAKAEMPEGDNGMVERNEADEDADADEMA